MTARRTRAWQDPERFGIGRLFFLTTEAIVAADLSSETIVLWNPAAERAASATRRTRPLGMPPRRPRAGSTASRSTCGHPPVHGGRRPRCSCGKDAGRRRRPSRRPARPGTSRCRSPTCRGTTTAGSSSRCSATSPPERDGRARGGRRHRGHAGLRGHRVPRPAVTARRPSSGSPSCSPTAATSCDAERRQTCLEAIERGAQQASRLVDDLLTLSHINAGASSRPQPERVAVAEVARQAVADTGVDATVGGRRRACRRRSIRSTCAGSSSNYLVNADRPRQPRRCVITAEPRPATGIEVRRATTAARACPTASSDRAVHHLRRADESDRRGTGPGAVDRAGPRGRANGGRAFYDGPPRAPASASSSPGPCQPASPRPAALGLGSTSTAWPTSADAAIVAWIARFAASLLFRRVEVAGLERYPTGSARAARGQPLQRLRRPRADRHRARAAAALHRQGGPAEDPDRRAGAPQRRGGVRAPRVDTEGGRSSNEDAFVECHRALAERDVVAIFPEGTTHDRAQIDPIKTGAARIALGARAAGAPRRSPSCPWG